MQDRLAAESAGERKARLCTANEMINQNERLAAESGLLKKEKIDSNVLKRVLNSC